MLDKVERPGWEIKDKKGSFAYISKHLLHIDHHNYQRDNISQSKLLDMAKKWSWVACAALVVAKRDDGTFWVIDGQHRYEAALRRDDIRDLPCLVFDMRGNIKAEAEGFLDVNTNRKSMQYIARFKAENTAEHEDAIFIKQLVEGSGRVIGADGNKRTVRCVGSLMAWSKRGHRDTLKRIWPLIDNLHRDTTIHLHLVDGLMQLELSLQQPYSLSDKKIYRRLLEIGEKELLEGARKASAYRGKGGAKVWAEGICQRYDRQLQNKLPLREGAFS